MLPKQFMCLVFALSSTYIRASDHVKRQVSVTNGTAMLVSVRPRLVYLYPWDTLTVRCKVTGGASIEEAPFVSFYRQLNFPGINTVLPLSSGSPGITIEASVPLVHHHDDLKRALTYLTIGPDVFRTLQQGENKFYCKGSNMLGLSETASFKVIRVDPRTDRRGPV